MNEQKLVAVDVQDALLFSWDGIEIGTYKCRNFAFICPVCGDFVEVGSVKPITSGANGESFCPVCNRCKQSIEHLGLVGKTHEEIDNMFKEECKKRGIELICSYPQIGGVIRKLAEWKEEQSG